MKGQYLLISLFSIMALNVNAADGKQPEEIYVQAKASYANNNCSSTIDLLTKYLTVASPSQGKRDSIYSVIGWCSVYINAGNEITYSRIKTELGQIEYLEETVETTFGVEMRNNKKKLFNKLSATDLQVRR